MEKKKLNIKVKIAVGIIIFIVALFIGSFVYYKQGIKATSSKNKEVIVTIPKGSSGNDIIKILDKNKLIKSSTCAKIYLKMNQHDFKSNVYILNKKMDLKTIFKAIEGKEKFIETTHLVDKVFDPALNVQHTEDIIINHLDAAENQYKQKLKEINLGEITNYVHQNPI